MKKYLADILTFSRIILAISLIVFSFFDFPIYQAFLVFLIAELTDSFDGTCSRKWPFPAGKEPKYRKYAVKYDMWADALLWFSVMLFLTLRINTVFGLIIMLGTAIICAIIELIIYGRFFGHPNDCTKNSLCAKNFSLAKKIIMARRWFYLSTIIVAVLWMLIVSEFSATAKIIVLSICVMIGLFLWFFLEQRRKNISRDAEELEKKMLKKSQK